MALALSHFHFITLMPPMRQMRCRQSFSIATPLSLMPNSR
jgi:hypothetical protein